MSSGYELEMYPVFLISGYIRNVRFNKAYGRNHHGTISIYRYAANCSLHNYASLMLSSQVIICLGPTYKSCYQ